jgi:hypothetical protein
LLQLENQTQKVMIEDLRAKVTRLTDEIEVQNQIIQTQKRRNTVVQQQQQISVNDERMKALEADNENLSQLVDDFTLQLQKKSALISDLEAQLVQLRTTETQQAEKIEQLKRIPVNYEQQQQITRLEIELDGQKRLMNIQQNRCTQLQQMYVFDLNLNLAK